MDGDSYKRRKYDSSSHPTAAGIGHSTLRHLPGASLDRFRPPLPSTPPRHTPPDSSIQAASRTAALSSFGGFEYAQSPSYNGASFQAGSPIQSGGLQYQQDFSAGPPRQHPSQVTQQQHEPQGQHHRIPQQQFEVYGIGQQSQQQTSYDVTSNYQPRQSTAIEVLATQFGVPQYLPSDDSGGAGTTNQYLSAQVHPNAYSQAPSAVRSNAPTGFPDAMPEFNAAPVSSEPQESQELQQRQNSNIETSNNQYQQTLRQTFEYIRSSHLVEASQSLLEISDWLLGNVIELGYTRDVQELHADRIKLWDEFNTCWLALFQKQKDTTLAMLETGAQLDNVLDETVLKKMAKELIRLCDKMEQHGLVDYQMGVWEEEILCVICDCVDLLDRETTRQSNSHSTQESQAQHTGPASSSL